MNLFTTELRRFWGRRITKGVLAIALFLSALAAVLTFAFTDSPSTTNNERAVAEAQRQTQQCVISITRDVDSGVFGDPELVDRRSTMSTEEFADFLAADYCYQDPSRYQSENIFNATDLLGIDSYDDWSEGRPDGKRFTFRSGTEQFEEARFGLQGVIPSIAIFLLVLSVVVGASFMGAEYKFGTVENLLLWEPRRTKVIGTKFAAGFVSSTVLTALVLSALAALLYIVAAIKGTTGGVDGRFWIDLASVIGRAAVTGGLFFIIAMSVAVLARNTTASVGLILGWFVISNILISVALKFFRQWELFTNATAFIGEGDASKYVKVQNDSILVYGHGYLAAGLVVVVWAVLLAAAATFVFNRRDVD